MLGMIFVYCAVIGGVFLLLQLLMMFIGSDEGGDIGDVDGGFDGDIDSGDINGHASNSLFFEIFSLRTVASAVTFFGLVGMAVLRSGGTESQAISFGAIAGMASLYGVYWIYKQLYRLQSSGNQNIQNAIGLPAQVYVPIPAANQGRGKVQFQMQGRIVEYQAVTDDDAKLATGEHVYVHQVVNADTVLVSRAVPATIESATT